MFVISQKTNPDKYKCTYIYKRILMTPKLNLTTFFNNVKMLQIEKHGKLKINQLLKSQVVYALKPLSGLSGHTTVLMSVDVTSPVTSSSNIQLHCRQLLHLASVESVKWYLNKHNVLNQDFKKC